VLRLQVPATPDPYDEETPEAERRAVLSLLPMAEAPEAEKVHMHKADLELEH
jgi:hypothetical protein